MDPIDLKQAPGKSHSLCPRSGQGQQSEGSGQSSQTSNNTTRFKAKSEYKGKPMKETGSRSSTLNMLPSAPQQDGNGKRQEGGDEHRQSSTAQSVNSVPQSSSRVASEMEDHISQNGVPETFNGTCYFSQARTQSLSTRHAPDEGGSGAHHSPEEPAMVSSSSILRNFGLWIFDWGNGKTVTEEDKRRYTSKLERQNFELNQTLAKVKTEFSAFEKEAYETIAHHEQNNRELSSRFQQVKGEMMIHKTQIQKMSKIIASLNQRGLPLPPDDGYFHEEFKGIIAEIRQWARLFTRGQPQLSPETLQQLEYKIPEKSRETLLRNFAHWQSPGIFDLYNALGTKFRTRCVEILLCGSAFEGLLLGPPVGLASQLYTLNDLSCCMGTASDEDKHLWRALSVHLLTQDNTMFAKVRTQKVHEITEASLKELEPFGVTDRASPEALYDIVERISELGLLIAKLPYIIHPLGANEALSPGCPFQADLMETLESSSESEMELQLEKVPTSLFLCQPWVKAPFTPDGRFGEHYSTVIMKAKVSCLV